MIILVLAVIGVITTAIAIAMLVTKDISLPENAKFKKMTIGALVVSLLSLLGVGQSVLLVKKGHDLGLGNQSAVSTPTTTSVLKEELVKKEEQLAVMTEKVRKAVEEARQAKAESELHTANVVKLQEEILRRTDEFSLLKEELDLRYKVDAEKKLRENEDRIRKSAATEAQRLVEAEKLKARIKVAKDDIEAKIVSKWTPPKDKHDLVVVAKYYVDSTGKTSNITLTQKSGNLEVDASVVDAITAASPVPLSSEDAVRNALREVTSKFILP